jgi:adenylate cyclase
VLNQPDFLASPRLATFLRFVVTETLEGRADRLKAFTIASMAFGHGEEFNPATNSAVRVHAGRLRRVLDLYYKGAGRCDRCEIRLPRGSYVPEFLFRSPDDRLAQPQNSVPDMLATHANRTDRRHLFDPSKWVHRLRASRVNAVSILAATALGLGAWAWHDGIAAALFGNRSSAPPIGAGWAGSAATITVDPIEGLGDDHAMSTFASLLRKELENALSGFDNPVVLSGRDAARPFSNLDYRLSGTVNAATDGNITLAFRIWHPASGEIIWTRTFDELHLEKNAAALEPTISALTSAVAQTYGVLFSDMRKRLSGIPDGFGCVILASDYFKMPSPAAHTAARNCLERVVAQHRHFAPGFAALSYLMVDTYLNGIDARPDEKPLDVAIEMANRAVDLAPQKARMHAAIFQTRFFDKRFEDAFASAERALQLNPYTTDTAARIGFAHVLRGELASGVTLLQRAIHFSPSTPGWYEFPLFLDAHMRGDQPSALRHAMRHSATRFPLGIVARIIVAHEQDDAAAVAQWSARLFEDYPVFANDVPAAFDRYAMAPEIRNRLLADLGAAGFPTRSQ